MHALQVKVSGDGGTGGKLKSVAGWMHAQVKVEYEMETSVNGPSMSKTSHKNNRHARWVKAWLSCKALAQVENSFLSKLQLTVHTESRPIASLKDMLEKSGTLRPSTGIQQSGE